MTTVCLSITSLSFADDLELIPSGTTVKNMAQSFETVAKTALKWDTVNTLTYNILKTRAKFYSQLYCQCLIKKIQE